MSFIHLNWGWGIVWVLAIALLAFLWLPGIKEFTSKWFSLNKKIDEVLVDYDEFKKTIYPLLEASMGQIVSVLYLQMPPKSSVMTSYVPLVEKAMRKENITQSEMVELLRAVKSMTLYGFSVELGAIASRASNRKIEQQTIENKVHHGLENDYSKRNYVNEDEIAVDFDFLDKVATELPEGKDKIRYENRLKDFRNFYNRYFN